MPYALKDASLAITRALPSAAATVNSSSIDLMNPSGKDLLAPMELELSAPALTVGQLANASTMTYAIEHSTDNSTFTAFQSSFLVQTGAGGVGAAAATKRFIAPTGINRYVRLSVVNSAAADASAASATLTPYF